MKLAISFGFYILFLIANIEGRFLLVNVGNPDVDDDYDGPRKPKPVNLGDPIVDDDDGPRKNNPEIGKNDCRIEFTVFRHMLQNYPKLIYIIWKHSIDVDMSRLLSLLFASNMSSLSY